MGPYYNIQKTKRQPQRKDSEAETQEQAKAPLSSIPRNGWIESLAAALRSNPKKSSAPTPV